MSLISESQGIGVYDRLRFGTDYACFQHGVRKPDHPQCAIDAFIRQNPEQLMFRKYLLTLFRLRIMTLLPYHERPATIVHNNIFGGEGARRFQPQNSITLFKSEFCSATDNKYIRENWIQIGGQEGSSWCLTVIVVDKRLASPARRTTIPATLQTQAEIESVLGGSHWESYVIAAILKVRTRSRVGWLSKDVKGRRKSLRERNVRSDFACVGAGPLTICG